VKVTGAVLSKYGLEELIRLLGIIEDDAYDRQVSKMVSVMRRIAEL